MCLGAAVEDKDGLPDRVAPSLRKSVDPHPVVHSACSQSVHVVSRRSLTHAVHRENIHAQTSEAVRGVEEADTASIDTSSRRNPRHDEKENLDQDPENDNDIPSLEFWCFCVDALSMTTNEVQSNSHYKDEHGIWIGLQIYHEVECITKWWSDNHHDCKDVFKKIRSERCAKRLSGSPECRIWQNTLSKNMSAKI